ncbi:hypothetical protein K7X08_029480 [Anisodus acutangulus]|uniref:Protein kinase domain-containing protein n=1 Tax=Anisodus acutangulus TaxID=402998 RepID=A0A9Q1L4E3_9SOLA|nr:hypothetical protein K7X08_029480 [Anisodus acutangulus]
MSLGEELRSLLGLVESANNLFQSQLIYTQKRIKFVVCDYYPMGSLADLLAGARDLGQTVLEWKQCLKIILCIARGIASIHPQNPPKDQKDHKDIQLNVHGNVKASYVMINIDFTACLSDYGFVQLAERTEFSDT